MDGRLEGIFDVAMDERSLAYALRSEHDDFGFETAAHYGRDVVVVIGSWSVDIGLRRRSGQDIGP